MANSELLNEMEHFLELNGIKFKVILEKKILYQKKGKLNKKYGRMAAEVRASP